jgi:hypothetical protein
MGEMKKLLSILCLSLAITGVLSFENSANAALSITGNVVQDSNTGLEWLMMSQTVNKSPDRIMAGDYGLKASGWVHATISQIETLFLNAGILKPFDMTLSPWNFDATNHLISLLGYTLESYNQNGRSLELRAFSATPDTSWPGNVYALSIQVESTPTGDVGMAYSAGASYPSGTYAPWMGNWLVRANPTITSPTFGPNSATLTNNYAPMKVGDKLTYKSYGYPVILYGYDEAINQESIDQIRCLKIKDYSSFSSTAAAYYWLAQDTSGNVWILKYHDVELNDLRYYGRNYAKIFMPSAVNVGSVLWVPDAIETVVATGISVPKLSTGLGPYYNCIKSKLTWMDGDIDYQYYAPGVGPVRHEWNDDAGTNGDEISAITHRPKSMPWLPLLLDD